MAHKKLSEYKNIRIIGTGAYAKVTLMQHIKSKKRYAVKIY